MRPGERPRPVLAPCRVRTCAREPERDGRANQRIGILIVLIQFRGGMGEWDPKWDFDSVWFLLRHLIVSFYDSPSLPSPIYSICKVYGTPSRTLALQERVYPSIVDIRTALEVRALRYSLRLYGVTSYLGFTRLSRSLKTLG